MYLHQRFLHRAYRNNRKVRQCPILPGLFVYLSKQGFIPKKNVRRRVADLPAGRERAKTQQSFYVVFVELGRAEK